MVGHADGCSPIFRHVNKCYFKLYIYIHTVYLHLMSFLHVNKHNILHVNCHCILRANIHCILHINLHYILHCQMLHVHVGIDDLLMLIYKTYNLTYLNPTLCIIINMFNICQNTISYIHQTAKVRIKFSIIQYIYPFVYPLELSS